MDQELWNDIVEMYDSEQSLRAKYSFFYHTLHRVCTEHLRGLTTTYNDFFSRLQAVCRLTNYRLYEVDRFRWRARRVMQGEAEPQDDTYEMDVRAFVEAYAHFTQSTIPDKLRTAILSKIDVRKKDVGQPYKGVGTRHRSVRFVFCSKDDQFIYAVCGQLPREDLWKIEFHQNEQTLDATELLEDGMQFNAVNYTVDEQSGVVVPEMLIIDPDFLVDVTSVCRCMKEYGSSPLNYLLDKLSDDEMSKAMILGNIAGQFLDDCINDSQATYLDSMRKAFKASMVDITTCDGLDAEFFNECKKQFSNIRRTIDQLYVAPDFVGAEGNVQLEPSFFCEALGIQGRFDFLQCDYKNLIEMKSGQWDGFHQAAKREHIMQMILYKEILYHNLGIPQNAISGYLFYSRYPMLQEQRTAREMVWQMMSIRNNIVILERGIRDGKVRDYLEHLTADDLNLNGVTNKLWTDYNKPDLEKLLKPIQEMDTLTADYFYTFFTFVAREQYLAKVGDNRPDSTRGMASLWNADLETKMQNGDIMIDLSLVQEKAMCTGEPITHVTLLKPVADTAVMELPPNFRVGDPVILYQRNKPADNAVTRQVLRCSVEAFDNDTLTLQLNHPQTNVRWFNPASRYAVEHDYMDASMRQQYKGLYAFLKVSPQRRDLLLGRRLPEVDDSQMLRGTYPNSQIADIVLRAKRAKDYFLLVGPPGTGKTSVALKAMVDECVLERQSLLLMAYTNRAVDEICEMLGERSYIRLGRDLSCDPVYRSHLLEAMVGDDTSRNAVRSMLLNVPIWVGTVSSILSHKALFKLRRFDVAIFDEASQILEPQLLGLLCNEHDGLPSIGRFVMIGDHKQLPAVVVQDEEVAKVKSSQLNAIGLTNCCNSMFERLFGMALQRPERGVTASLDHQGRMHPDIAAFVNSMFYDEQLKPVGLQHQTENLRYTIHTEAETYVATTRFGFIDIPLPSLEERQPKMNLVEAQTIAEIVEQMIHLAAENNLPFDICKDMGIIVPFRRQIVAVRQALYARGICGVDKMMIDTVERYQGSQRDVIIYGTTITQPYELEMLSNIVDVGGCKVDRKLNVAVTRARRQLFVLGNRQLLTRNPVYRELINYTQN